MGIANRFINIVKTNRKDFDDDGVLSEAEIYNLLKDDSDDELSKQISDASKNHIPVDIENAFVSLEMPPIKDLNLVSLQFKNLMNKYHPDKNSVADKQYFNDKTSEIISAYSKIKEYIEK